MRKGALWLALLIRGAVLSGQEPESPADSLLVNTEQVFELGEVTVFGERDLPFALKVDARKLTFAQQRDVSSALAQLPGLNFVHQGQRNESMLNVRGFDMRQIPVYLDGVPVYVSYDGYTDLGRFLVADLSRITVTRGETSLIAGPNALGGAINMISRIPASPLELNVAAATSFHRRGWGGWQSGLQMGSRKERYYVQLGFASIARRPYARSAREGEVWNSGGSVQFNSQQRDVNGSLKAGFTPNDTDRYVASFHFQEGSKGVPVYDGEDPYQRARFWEFPLVRRTGLHLNTKTQIGERSYLQTRWFFDRYLSDLKSYDDSTLTTQDRSSSFTSIYNDHILGGSVIYNIVPDERHELRVAVHALVDHHTERNSHPVSETPREFRDETYSAVIEDEFRILENLTARAGIGFHWKKSLRADDYLPSFDSVFPFPENVSWAWNILAGADYEWRQEHRFSAHLSRKNRFPTMKDRYSYRLGRSIPNPGLLSEFSWNSDVGYAYIPGSHMQAKATLFYSHLTQTIQPVYGVDPQNSAVYQFQNTGVSRYFGWELEASWAPFPETRLGLQYTLTGRKNLTNPEIYFTDVPRHKLFGSMRYTLFESVRIELTGLYNSSRISTSTGEFKTDPFFTLGFHVSAQVSEFTIEAGISNLLDAAYSYVEGYPAPGREITLGLHYRLR